MERLMMPRMPIPQIRFSSNPSMANSPEEDYKPVLARKRKILEQATAAKGLLSYSSNGRSERHNLQNTITQQRDRFWDNCKNILFALSFFPAILSGTVTGYLGYKAVSNVVEGSKRGGALQDSIFGWAFAEGMGSLLAGCFLFGTLTNGLGNGYGGNHESEYYRRALLAFREYRTARSKLKQLQRKTLTLKPVQDPLDQKMLEVLNRKITRMTEQFAQRFQQKYDAVPEFRQFCQNVFGSGKESLPTAQGLRDLFEYYVYRQIKDNQGSLLGNSRSGTTELEATQRLFSMMMIGSKMGDVFKFMTPQSGDSYEQVFNRALLPEIEVMEQVIQSQLETVRELMKKEMETENYIALAGDALAPLELGELDRKAEADELKALIQEFAQRKDKIAEALRNGVFKSDANALFLDETLLNELKTELSQFMARLKTALMLERREDQLQAQATSLLCEVSSPDVNGLAAPPAQTATGGASS